MTRGLARVALLLFAGAILPTSAAAADKPAKQGHPSSKAYQLIVQKCTGCHVSVVDPERPGKTRDEWYAVVRVMQAHGFKLTDQETEAIVDHLYAVRRGIEKTPG
jgi:Quinohemoprotein amine dehydrogenase A, alpha subunit, haem binding